MTTDPRIEAAAVAIASKVHTRDFDVMATAALAAADNAATITTVEGLDALPAGSVIRDDSEYVFELIPNPAGQSEWWSTVDSITTSPYPTLPARVIHFGGQS